MPRGILCGRGYLRENCRVKLPHASVYKRKGSPRWTIAYWSPQRKKRVFVTTPYRISESDGLQQAFAKALDFSVRAAADRRHLGNDRWERWVPEFLALRYGNSAASLRRTRLVSDERGVRRGAFVGPCADRRRLAGPPSRTAA